MNWLINFLPWVVIAGMAFVPHEWGVWQRAVAVIAAFSVCYVCARVIPARQARAAKIRGEA